MDTVIVSVGKKCSKLQWDMIKENLVDLLTKTFQTFWKTSRGKSKNFIIGRKILLANA